ncbi:MAG: DNA translocase FtsK 4TM domain-containing protein [bacterium]
MGRRRKRDNPWDYLRIPHLNISSEIRRGIWALFILALAIISILALFDSAGMLGHYFGLAMTWLFGWGKWVFPFILFILSFLLFNQRKFDIGAMNYFGFFLFVLFFQGLLQLFVNDAEWVTAIAQGAGGGHIGWGVAAFLISLMGFWATLVFIACFILISLMLAFNTTLATLLDRGSWPARMLIHPFKFLYTKLFTTEQYDEEDDIEEEDEEEIQDDEDEEEEEEDDDEEEDEEEGEEDQVGRPNLGSLVGTGIPATSLVAENLWQSTNIKIDLPLTLLNSKNGEPKSGDIKRSSMIIQKTLEEFGISVEMGEVNVGPTVTQYSFKPADGVKLSRITNLNNDLAMALAAHPVRIEAPIPGKSLVGIEVPNKTVAIVGLRGILESEVYTKRKTDTMIALGRDVTGKSWMANLCRMPHLLVAGATGSGKSVMLNSLIVSLLYQNNPDDLRFIMVDPKRVELTVYDGIPHLITPVITEISKTINALKWCLNEMDRRFSILAKAKKRDIDSYNKVHKNNKMPYIIFVIDELADLMVVAAKDIETGIVRLAQMARAVGIHLVLATQRPSVNVITGTIKANMPARIAFSVASGIDSRTILDGLGAEKLLGKGDMLFSNAALPKPKRIQGAYVTDSEIKRIVAFLKSKANPIYLDNVTERQKVVGMAGVGIDGARDDDDELTAEAKEIVINAGKASATLLQRRLSIGYARAAKILDTLEEAGVIGQSQGSKPREVLITKEQYEALSSQAVSGMALHNRDQSKALDDYLPEDDGLESGNGHDEDDEEDNDEEDEDDDGIESDFSGEDDDFDDNEEDEEEEDEEDETENEDEDEGEDEEIEDDLEDDEGNDEDSGEIDGGADDDEDEEEGEEDFEKLYSR